MSLAMSHFTSCNQLLQSDIDYNFMILNFKRLSSNATTVFFGYLQIYLNKKGIICKARVNEWIINQI